MAEALGRAGVTHLHGHFCHSATTISWLAAEMAGVPFSFTAHAKDIYQTRHNPGDLLGRKVAAARFVTTCTAANHNHMSERVADTRKLHTVYHGLDTAFFHPRAPREQRPGAHSGGRSACREKGLRRAAGRAGGIAATRDGLSLSD